MNVDLILTLVEAAPTVVGDVEAAVSKLKGDTALAAKVSDGIAALQHLVIDLQNVINKL